jgi:phage gp36-like protein
MADYCTVEDIKAEIGLKDIENLTTNSGELVKYREERLTSIIDNRTKFCNGFLRTRYPLPFTGDTDGIVKSICIMLVIYDLYSAASHIPKKYEDYETKAIERLKDIQRGVIILDTGDETEVNYKPPFYAVKSPHKVFPNHTLRAFEGRQHRYYD